MSATCRRGCCSAVTPELAQAEHYRGVALAPPTPSMWAAKRKDAALNADMAAYKRLRQSNVQPKNVNGSALLESRATSEFEVAAGQILPDRKSVKLTESVLGDIGGGG